jgi:hypothetical protein
MTVMFRNKKTQPVKKVGSAATSRWPAGGGRLGLAAISLPNKKLLKWLKMNEKNVFDDAYLHNL